MSGLRPPAWWIPVALLVGIVVGVVGFALWDRSRDAEIARELREQVRTAEALADSAAAVSRDLRASRDSALAESRADSVRNAEENERLRRVAARARSRADSIADSIVADFPDVEARLAELQAEHDAERAADAERIENLVGEIVGLRITVAKDARLIVALTEEVELTRNRAVAAEARAEAEARARASANRFSKLSLGGNAVLAGVAVVLLLK